ncbi:MAG: hypothetical protein ACOY3I_05145 [Verrucomicrobiota bacterium]
MSSDGIARSAERVAANVKHSKAISTAPQRTAIDLMPTQPEPAPQPQIAQPEPSPQPQPKVEAPAPAQPKAPQQPSKVAEVRIETPKQNVKNHNLQVIQGGKEAPKASPSMPASTAGGGGVNIENAMQPRKNRTVSSISSLLPQNRMKMPSISAHIPSPSISKTQDLSLAA